MNETELIAYEALRENLAELGALLKYGYMEYREYAHVAAGINRLLAVFESY